MLLITPPTARQRVSLGTSPASRATQSYPLLSHPELSLNQLHPVQDSVASKDH